MRPSWFVASQLATQIHQYDRHNRVPLLAATCKGVDPCWSGISTSTSSSARRDTTLMLLGTKNRHTSVKPLILKLLCRWSFQVLISCISLCLGVRLKQRILAVPLFDSVLSDAVFFLRQNRESSCPSWCHRGGGSGEGVHLALRSLEGAVLNHFNAIFGSQLFVASHPSCALHNYGPFNQVAVHVTLNRSTKVPVTSANSVGPLPTNLLPSLARLTPEVNISFLFGSQHECKKDAHGVWTP